MSRFFTLCAALAAVWSASARADGTCDVLKRIVAAELAADQAALADAQGDGRILPPGMQCTLTVIEKMWAYRCTTPALAKAAANAQAARMTASVAACYPQPRPAKTYTTGDEISTLFTVDASPFMSIRVDSTHDIAYASKLFVAGFAVETVVNKEGEK